MPCKAAEERRGALARELRLGHFQADAECPLVGLAADPGRFLHADGDAGVEALPDARHGEEGGGRHLADVVGHRLGALGEVGDGAGAQRQEGGEGALGDVTERQEGELLVVGADRDEGVGVAELEDDVAVREHRALGRAGGAGGVDQQGELRRLGACDQLLPQAGMRDIVGAAQRQKLVERHDQRVAEICQAFHVEDEDLGDLRAALAHLYELVELLVVLDEQEARLAVVQDVVDLLGRVGRVDTVGNAAGAHRTHVGVEPFGHRIGQDRHDLAALEAELDQTHACPARALAVVAPRGGAPDAELLLTEGGTAVARLDLMPEQFGNRVAAFDLDPPVQARHRALRRLPVFAIAHACYRHVLRFFQRRWPRAPCSLMPR